MTESRKAYFINQLERTIDGEYIPCIAVENEYGYYKTNWEWGDDLELAEQIADEKNARLGLTPKDAMLIQLSSMRKG